MSKIYMAVTVEQGKNERLFEQRPSEEYEPGNYSYAVYLARDEMSLDAAATLHGLIYGDERITDVSPTDGDYDADDDWY